MPPLLLPAACTQAVYAVPMGTRCTMLSFWICWHVFSTSTSSLPMEPLHALSASVAPLQGRRAGRKQRVHQLKSFSTCSYGRGAAPCVGSGGGSGCRLGCVPRQCLQAVNLAAITALAVPTHVRWEKRMTPAGRSILAASEPPTTRSDRCFSACNSEQCRQEVGG